MNNQPVLIIAPYSFTGKLYDAYNHAFSLVGDNDWICFKDGDVCFIEMSNFGHLLQEYIDAYPDTGIFTCYASRCHYQFQTRKGTDASNTSLSYWAKQVVNVKNTLHLKTKQIDERIAGHLILMKKSTWLTIQPTLTKRLQSKNKYILGFDTQLSHSIFQHGFDIKLMRGILVLHYLRLLTGKNTYIK